MPNAFVSSSFFWWKKMPRPGWDSNLTPIRPRLCMSLALGFLICGIEGPHSASQVTRGDKMKVKIIGTVNQSRLGDVSQLSSCERQRAHNGLSCCHIAGFAKILSSVHLPPPPLFSSCLSACLSCTLHKLSPNFLILRTERYCFLELNKRNFSTLIKP